MCPRTSPMSISRTSCCAIAPSSYAKKSPGGQRELAKTDRNGRLAGLVAPLVNWANNRRNWLTRSAMEKMLGIDRRAALPSFHGRTFVMRSKRLVPPVDYSAPAAGREAVLYATCFINYNNPHIGEATRAVLSRNGVETEVLYPQCCGNAATRAGRPRRGRQICFRGCSGFSAPG